MLELAVLAVVALIGVSGYRSYRQRGENKQAMITPPKEEKEAGPSRLTSAKNWFVGKTNTIRDTIGRKSQPDPVKLLQAWAAESLSQNKGLQMWITTLSDNGAKALTDQLSDFCHNLNLELLWLVDKGLDKDSELKAQVAEIVTSYCNACWKAAEAQDELKTYQTILSLQENPNKKENRVLSQNIFTELVKRNLTTSTPPELFLAEDKERHEHVMSAIQKAADKDRKAFNRVVNAVISNNTKEATPAETQQPVTAAA